MRRTLLLRPAAALGAVLLTAACSAGTPAADPSPAAATSAGPGVPSTAPASPATTPPGAAPPGTTAPTSVPTVTPAGPQVRRLAVTVRTDGPVTGDTGTVDVAVGEPIELTVTSDVADEVHVHGPDVRADVPPGGGTVVLTFAQPAPGRYDVELETGGRVLLRLQAR